MKHGMGSIRTGAGRNTLNGSSMGRIVGGNSDQVSVATLARFIDSI